MPGKIKEYLQDYGKPAAAVGSAGLAGFAAIDQALQGDTEMMQMMAENSELIDNIGHQATGVFGAIAAEYGFSALKEDEEDQEGFAKYAVMLAGAYSAGFAGQGAQYVISGTPELLAATDSMTGGLYATVAQIGADSHDRNSSNGFEDPEIYGLTTEYEDPELNQEWNAVKASIQLYLEDQENYEKLDDIQDLPDGFEDSEGEWHDEIVQVEVDSESFRQFFERLISETSYDSKMEYVWGDVLEENHEKILDDFYDDTNRVRRVSQVPEADSWKEVIVTDEGDNIRFTGEANAAVGVPDSDLDGQLKNLDETPLEWMDESFEENYELVVSVDVPKEDVLDVFRFVKPESRKKSEI